MKRASRALAMTLLAQAPPDLPPPEAPPTAEQLAQACNAKDKAACVRLVAMYETGDGVPCDLPKAIAWAKRACRAGEIERGCAFVGLKVVTSQAPNRGRDAAPYLDRACYEENALAATACERLGELYLAQQEPGFEPILTKRALQRGCEKGSTSACTRERSVPLGPGATEWRDLGSPLGVDALITEWFALSDKQSLVIVGPNFSRKDAREELWRTTDGGQTWARVHESPLLGGGSFGRRLAADGKIVIYRTKEAWLRSTDGGATWSPIASLVASKAAANSWSVARVGREFFIADQKQLLASTDGGKTFVHRLDAPDLIQCVLGTTDNLFLKLQGSDGKGYRVEGTRLVEAETFPFSDGKVAARS